MHLGLFWGPVRGTLVLSGTAKTAGGFAPEPLGLYFEGLLPETSRAFGFYHVDGLKRLQGPSRSVLGPFGPPRKTTKNDGGFAPEPRLGLFQATRTAS